MKHRETGEERADVGAKKNYGSGKRRDRRIRIKKNDLKTWKFCGTSGEVKEEDLFSEPGNILEQVRERE